MRLKKMLELVNVMPRMVWIKFVGELGSHLYFTDSMPEWILDRWVVFRKASYSVDGNPIICLH